MHAELARPGVTRLLLWQEYKASQPEGWQYSVFCDQYRRWLATQELVFRQNHAPGEKCFVDYAGQSVAILDRHGGESREAQVFVAVLGCSNYTYAEATWTQGLADWLGSHVRALEFFGGAPGAMVPDNLKSGVTRAHRYEPEINPATRTSPNTMALRSCPRVCANRATRRRSKRACWWWRGGYLHAFATSRSSRWASSTSRSQNCSSN